MKIFSALLTLSIAVSTTLAAQSTCKNPVNCSCGSTNKTITVCVETENKEIEPCKKWSRCKSCQDGLNSCLQCEDGFEGPLCTIPARQKSRRKRQVFFNMWQEEFQRRNNQVGNCRSIDSPKFGSIRCTYSDQQRTCVGRCLPGYDFENYESQTEMTLTCQRGAWTPLTSFPPCKSGGHCDLNVHGAGSFNCTTGMTGTRCDVRCAGRYTGQYYCYPGRNWEPRLPECVAPKEVVNERSSCRCEYGGSCDTNGNCVCPVGRTGTFCETIVPDREMCDDPGFILNGFRRYTDGTESTTPCLFEEGESVVYGCESEDFALQGSSYLTCRSDRTWSSPLPRCIESADSRGCPDPGQVANADRLNSDGSPSNGVQRYRVGQSVVYTCHPGFALQRRSLVTCRSSGSWSSRIPFCSRIAPPSPPGNIIRTPAPGSVIRYCRDLGSFVPNGRRQPRIPPSRRGFPQGSQVDYFCNEGYDLIGESSLFCLTSGRWSGSSPRCDVESQTQASEPDIYCENPGPFTNGLVEYIPLRISNNPMPRIIFDAAGEDYPEGSRLQYSCEIGYALDGPDTLTCEASGSWSANPPRCISIRPPIVMFCSNPGIISNGRFKVISPIGTPRTASRPSEDDDDYPEGTVLEYSCDDEYVLQGAYSLRCQSTTFWTTDPPTCIGADQNTNGSPRPDSGDSNSPAENRDCGRSVMQASRRILHGETTTSGEWPWVVAISVIRNNFTQLICGGAIVNTRVIVTAAHCLTGADRYTLFFGKKYSSVMKDDSEVMVRRSTRVIIHPDFTRTTYDSDIGLVMFEPRIRYSIRVQPICLPTGDSTAKILMTGRRGYVTGWGWTEKRLPSDELLVANLPVLTNEACMESYRNQNVSLAVSRNMFCAGFPVADQQSVCSGDSGSPFVFQDGSTGRYTVEGLVSFGVEGQCGQAGRYAIFTKVFMFVPWILRNLS